MCIRDRVRDVPHDVERHTVVEIIAHIGHTVSAVAQGNQPYFLFSTTIFGLATGSTVLTAQYWGKGELDPIRAIMGLILRVGMIAGALLGALVLAFPAAVMSIFTNDPQVIASGVEFLRIIAFSYVFAAFTGVFLISLRSMENVRVSLCIYGLSFALNLVLHWVFIFGNLGAPRMETVSYTHLASCGRSACGS